MMLMGDEYAHTRYGNNNSYGHDTAINHFQWGLVNFYIYIYIVESSMYVSSSFCYSLIDQKKWPIVNVLVRQLEARKSDHFRFFKEMIKFRWTHHVFSHENFLNKVIYFASLCFFVVLQSCWKCKFKYSGLERLMKPLFLQNDVTWHEDNWDNYNSKFLAFT